MEFLRVVPLAANPSGTLAPRKAPRRYIRARGVPSARSADRRTSTCRRTGPGIGRREWDGDPKGKARPLLTGLCKTCKEHRHSELCLARLPVSTVVDIQLRQIDAKPKRQPKNAKTAPPYIRAGRFVACGLDNARLKDEATAGRPSLADVSFKRAGLNEPARAGR